ncbi:MAG: hypothetical protein ACRDGS_16545, partial [Chloroflexota bacterium]
VLPPGRQSRGWWIGLIVAEVRHRRFAYRLANTLRAFGFTVTTHELSDPSEVDPRRLIDHGFAAVILFPSPIATDPFPEVLVFEDRTENSDLEETLVETAEECLAALGGQGDLAAAEVRA